MTHIEIAYEMMHLYDDSKADLYLVGGSVRDYLLFGDFQDFDFATPCLLKESLAILNVTKYDNFSAQFGTLKTKYSNQEVEITTFRKESGYSDLRHPDKIEFVKALAIDYQRRDFTINALYLDCKGKIHDPCHGQDDLNNRIIRCIGNTEQRIKEDPVRILRAIRFALRFNFRMDANLERAIMQYSYLLHEISLVRAKSELNKMLKNNTIKQIQAMFNKYQIDINIKDYIV